MEKVESAGDQWYVFIRRVIIDSLPQIHID